jgi:hypothetical protein
VSGLEDLIGQVMASHDDEAPGAAGLLDALGRARRRPGRLGPGRAQRHVRGYRAGRYIPLAAAVAIAVVAAASVWAGGLLAGRPVPSRTAIGAGRVQHLTCPARHAGTGSWVPAKPVRVDGRSRLVPPQTPSSALICAYAGSNTAKHQAGWLLSGRRVLSGGLGELASLLTWQPRGGPDQQLPCTLIGGKQTNYLIGLAYPGRGVVWVTTEDDPNHCFGSFNGEFMSFGVIGAIVSKAFTSGRWPARQPDSCHGGGPEVGRLGQDTALVPAGSTSLTICVHGGGRTFASGYQRLVLALNALRVRPSTHTCYHTTGRYGPFYQLVFAYRQGPAVDIMINSGCQPEIDNLSLQSESASTVLPIVTRLLRAH